MRHGLAALVSGILLFTSFPPLEWSPAAWVALVPLLLVADRVSPAKAFHTGLITGLMFWWPSLAWLTRVSWPGWLLVGLYCALYIAGFSMTVSWVLRSAERRGWLGTLGTLVVVPAIWVGFEYLRSMVFTGFPWNPLGVTQAGMLPLIQCAEWGGVYAVSFLVIMVNVALFFALFPAWSQRSDAAGQLWSEARSVRALWPLLATLVAIVLTWNCGVAAIRRETGGPAGAPLRVVLVQLNIPQFEKFTEECWTAIEVRLRRITAASINRYRPELVVWPETAVPTFVRGVPSTEKLIADLLTQGVPLLVGTTDFEQAGDTFRYFNSSFLFDPERGLIQTYAKRHLVCFGEYVPFSDVFPFLRRLTPIEESFTPGKEQTVFRLDTSPRAFSALICFEDTMAGLARMAVRAGARLLINQTNDAWFDPSWAPRQHMLQCIFRCVENRVPAVRSTNTGITCFIDRTGRVTGILAPTRGRDPLPECLAQTVWLPGPEMPLTFYTKYGDLFAQACVGFALLAIGAAALRLRTGRRQADEDIAAEPV